MTFIKLCKFFLSPEKFAIMSLIKHKGTLSAGLYP